MRQKESFLCEVFSLYSDEKPNTYHIVDTSHGEEDFRQAIFAEWNNQKVVIKIASNGFTTTHRVKGWHDTILAYRDMGYYCPAILPTRSGAVTTELEYQGRPCVVFAEEHSAQKTAEQWGKAVYRPRDRYVFHDEVLHFLGKVGSAHLTTADFPSGNCILEEFLPGEVDEIMENALQFKAVMDTMPQYSDRAEAIWQQYLDNKVKLAEVYPKLPTSVFQADPNYTNVLLDEQHRFVGLLDFNLCGRDTVLNILFRESFNWFYEDVLYHVPENGRYSDMFYLPDMNQRSLDSLIHNIQLMKETYSFTQDEIQAAPLLYRYMRPLWWTVQSCLLRNKENPVVVEAVLDWIQQEQQREIDFASIMS